MDNQIDYNLRETVSHGTYEFPVALYKKKFDGNNLSYISCHWHNEIEIVYCYEGELKYSTPGGEYILNENNFVIVNKNILHQADMTGKSKWNAILFDPRFIYGSEDSKIKEILDNHSYDSLLIEDKCLLNVVKEIINAYDDIYNPLRELKVKSKLTSLYLDILTTVLNNNLIVKPSAEQIKLHKILQYIHKNYREKITIEDICHEIGSSRSETCRIFKDSLKTTIADYIRCFRIEKSIALLMSGNLSIKEISDLSGFNSSSYYSEAFKQTINMTPFEYRKKNQQ